MENEKCVNVFSDEKLKLGQEHNGMCPQKMAGVLTREEILRYKLVIPEDNTPKDCLKPTTFDMTLGEGHYVYSGDKSDKEQRWELIFIGNADRLEELNKRGEEIEKYKRQSRNKVKTLTIPEYGSALIQLNETVDTWSVAEKEKLLIVGRFDLKLGNVHKGLISQQATQVEPYYKGKLFCFIHNLSNKKIELKYGEKIATIEFSYVSCTCELEKRLEIMQQLKDMNTAKYKNQSYCLENGIKEIRYFRDQERLPDDCGLLGLKDWFLDEMSSSEIAEYLIKSDQFMDDLAKKIGRRFSR